jgi:hypothetical protein
MTTVPRTGVIVDGMWHSVRHVMPALEALEVGHKQKRKDL